MLSPYSKRYRLYNYIIIGVIAITMYVLYFRTVVGIGSWSMNRTIHDEFFLDFGTQIKIFRFLCLTLPILLVWRIIKFYKVQSMSKLELSSILLIFLTTIVFFIFR